MILDWRTSEKLSLMVNMTWCHIEYRPHKLTAHMLWHHTPVPKKLLHFFYLSFYHLFYILHTHIQILHPIFCINLCVTEGSCNVWKYLRAWYTHCLSLCLSLSYIHSHKHLHIQQNKHDNTSTYPSKHIWWYVYTSIQTNMITRLHIHLNKHDNTSTYQVNQIWGHVYKSIQTSMMAIFHPVFCINLFVAEGSCHLWKSRRAS